MSFVKVVSARGRNLAGAALALSLLGAAGAAQADVTWQVTGVFNDGSALTGTFGINQYGYLSDWDLTTDAFHYVKPNDPASNGANDIAFYPGPYSNALNLLFLHGLGAPLGTNAIVGGVNGPSFECRNSFSCYTGDAGLGGDYRWIVSGSAHADGATVPEPAAWTMMIAGFGLAGAALRRRRVTSARFA